MKIVIIGNTIRSIKAIEEIRRHDTESSITLFCPEGHLPYHPDRLAQFIGKEVSLEETFCVGEDFFQNLRAEIVLEKKIEKVYAKRKRVVTEEKEQIPFDVLLLEDKGSWQFPDVKGTNKKGVFATRTLKDAKEILEMIPLVDVIALEANDLQALQMACMLRKAEKEVIFVCPGEYLLSHLVDRDTGDILSGMLKEKGIRILLENRIDEVLGDSDVKAVRLKTGKVFESQMAIFSAVQNKLSFFDIGEMSVREEELFSRAEDIFLVKDLQAETDAFEAALLNYESEGQSLGAVLISQELLPRLNFREISFKIFDSEITFLGKTKAKENSIVYSRHDNARRGFKKVFTQNDIPEGAVLINQDSEKDVYRKLIVENVSMMGLEKHIIEDQEAQAQGSSPEPVFQTSEEMGS